MFVTACSSHCDIHFDIIALWSKVYCFYLFIYCFLLIYLVLKKDGNSGNTLKLFTFNFLRYRKQTGHVMNDSTFQCFHQMRFSQVLWN